MQLSGVQRVTMLDFPGRIACIAFTPGCSMRCGFCHNPEFVLPEKITELAGSFISEDSFLRFLDTRTGLLEGVVVSGGEPTIWNDLPAFLRKIREKGFLVKLDTNGNHPAMLERIYGERLVDYVAMDIKASLDAYPELVGRGVRPENLEQSIALIMESGVDYEFRSTLIKEVHTKEMLLKMRDMIAGAKRFYLQTFRPGHTLSPVFRKCHPFAQTEMHSISELFGQNIPHVVIRN